MRRYQYADGAQYVMVASLLAIIGVIAIVFIKRPRFNHIGLILAGLGILFIGMELMSAAVMPLKSLMPFMISCQPLPIR
ncbi:MAG: hypothetical protein ACLVJ6_04450 [Merdibacter sp.]